MRFLAIIPARGGSKGVPRKNIRMVAGRPLIAWTIEAARLSGALDRIAVSTEDAEIAAIARAWGAEIFERPAALAEDATPTRDVLWHHVADCAAAGYHPDAVVTLQPTSPLRRPEQLRAACAAFAADPRADSLVSCIDVPHIFHPLSVMRLGPDGYLRPYLDQPATPTRRQEKPPALARNGAAIYITRTARLADYVFGGNLLPFPMPVEDSLDIDEEQDLEAAERCLRERHP
ncbi:cytidylyltransferase domain-containing protein [Rhabdaerophilum calidifontis]|uniref:acylneuraminate cytidylyltransferase family protein n=1 Tax=Rhabdaerophilum calidifontis TaxID=2604328 RepID=UPI00140ACF89|nr:acylneuraminate cytidylyltransferase family protein [Rhabdaerophilum calidifontis]